MEVIEVIDRPTEVIQVTEREVEVVETVERGPQGATGAVGPQGAAGQGVPIGGTTGQVLRKVSGTNYDTEWAVGGVTYGTTAGTATQGNDSRIANIAANSITTANSGGAGGTITMRGGITGSNGAGGNSGSINLRGSDDRDEGAFNGGSIDLSAANGAGGNITSTGNSEGAGGSLTMSGNGFAGGSINTSGGSNGVGGSIDTSNDGGSINTRGTGSIGFGESGTRTTLTGTATEDRAISLPNASGTLCLNPSEIDYEVTDSTKGIILKSPNNTRWRITIDNNGSLLRTAIALLLSAFLMCGAQAQVRDLVYGTNNVVIGPTNTNALTFTNRVTIPIASGAATTNSTLQADGSGGSAFVASRTVTRVTTNDQTKTNWAFNFITQSTNNDPQIGSFAINADSVYRVEFVVAFRGSSNASFRCGVGFATNLATINQRAGFFQSANTSITAINMPTNALNMPIQGDPAGNTNHTIAGLFYIYSGTNANSMTFRWWPANNTNLPITLLSNTMISVTKMSP